MYNRVALNFQHPIFLLSPPGTVAFHKKVIPEKVYCSGRTRKGSRTGKLYRNFVRIII